VDVIGVSLLSGAHMTHIARILAPLRAEGAGDIPVVAGGVIPDEDVSVLEAMGVRSWGGHDAAADLVSRAIDREVLRARRGIDLTVWPPRCGSHVRPAEDARHWLPELECGRARRCGPQVFRPVVEMPCT
jgi:hypothetical protein